MPFIEDITIKNPEPKSYMLFASTQMNEMDVSTNWHVEMKKNLFLELIEHHFWFGWDG